MQAGDAVPLDELHEEAAPHGLREDLAQPVLALAQLDDRRGPGTAQEAQPARLQRRERGDQRGDREGDVLQASQPAASRNSATWPPGPVGAASTTCAPLPACDRAMMSMPSADAAAR